MSHAGKNEISPAVLKATCIVDFAREGGR